MNWILDGFKQHPNKVVAIVAAIKKNLDDLKKLRVKYEVLIGEVITLPMGSGYTNKWVGVIINKKSMNLNRESNKSSTSNTK
jgi:hypothetical protein